MTFGQFGAYVKERRENRSLSLREFCRLANFDPSNWSKVERGLLSPPRNRECVSDIASVLLIAKDTEEWHKLFDLAAIDHIPESLVQKNVAKTMPVFFRMARGAEPNGRFIDQIKKCFREVEPPAKRRRRFKK
jgi:transcriptional regulator with XRE-family HTH domain